MALPTEKQFNALEQLIDALGLRQVLTMCGTICDGWIEVAIQDQDDIGPARQWSEASSRCWDAASKIELP
jgi:hypothetical protein